MTDRSSRNNRVSTQELSEVDKFVLFQGKELKRRKRAITAIFVRLAAMGLCMPRRRKELLEQVRKIAFKEQGRIFKLEHPPKKGK